MGTALLATKLHIPTVRPGLVPRPRLTGRLDEGLERKLTLVSAPAGFGKTTLVSEWAARCGRRESQIRIAWLSLDEGDNDLTRFLSYVIAALQTTQANLGAGALGLLQSPQPPSMEPILTALINDVVGDSKAPPTPSVGSGQDAACRFILVLDDYHVIQSRPVDAALAFLLDHLPSNMHLVIASRTDPSLPLSRLRAQGQMTEVRVDDLRFAPHEAAAFLNRTMGLNLSPKNVAALEARTEGWIAGLQLAALSMQGLRQGDSVASFVNGFAGSNRYILDYLTDEVLQQRPSGTEEFLLQTSILERLNGPLCDAVRFGFAEPPSASAEHAVRFGLAETPSGKKTSQAILEALEAANLFLVPLDDNRLWYRYHHLFADLLRQRLQRFQPEHVPKLHRRASQWFEHHGLIEEAVKHALGAQDFGGAARLLEKLAVELWERGEPSALLSWLDSLPEEQVIARPCLCSFFAWALFINGQNQAAERLLQAAERALDEEATGLAGDTAEGPDQLSELDIQEERGRVAAIRASLAFRRGDAPGVLQFSRQALEYLSEESLMWRSIVARDLGMAQDLSGDTVAASRTLSEAVATSKACGNIYLILSISLDLGAVLIAQGRLKQAYELCEELLKLAEERGVLHTEMAGCLYDELGLVLCEWNQLDEAKRHLEEGSKLSKQGCDVGVLGHSCLTMLRFLFAQGDTAGAQEIINETDRLGQGSDVPPWYTSPKEAWRGRLWLALGDLNAASQWVHDRGLNGDGELPYLREEEYIVLTRILLAQGRFEKARRLLVRLLRQAEKGGRIARVIEILMIKALACQAQSEEEGALAALARALSLAEEGGYVRAFVDEGAPMASLLRQAASRGVAEKVGVSSGYVRRLLAAFESSQARRPVPTEQPLIEPMSERELEVLRLIATGLSNREIAQELIIAVGTVKAHTSAIYRKLDVRGRAQAVIHARELNLL